MKTQLLTADPTPLPYYYPTTTCFVDDNAGFLEALLINLPANSPHLAFTSPTQALQEINQLNSKLNLMQRCFSYYGSGQVNVDITTLEQGIAHPNRFQDISVLVVDYAMPTLNGLELCQNLNAHDMGIVLLTGVAEESVAIEAFNAGLIHRYLRKSKIRDFSEILDVIEQMQKAYFYNASRLLFASLDADPTHFRNQQRFKKYFGDICSQYNIVEYYYVNNPNGYLLLDSEGKAIRLIVLTPEELTAQIRFAKQHQAPIDVLHPMVQGKVIGYFFEEPRDYGFESFPWADMLTSATQLKAQSHMEPDLIVGIHQQPPLDIEFDAKQASFGQYINQQTM